MALRTSADNAEDVAAGFRMFRDPLPEYATEITGLIADLYAISVSLKFLDDFASNRAYRHTLHHVQADLELVGTSLKHTLEDIVDFFGDLETRRGPSREVFKRTWLSLCSYFQEESKDSLSTRLIKYKTFLNELQDEFKDKDSDARLTARLRSNIKSLLLQQESQNSRLVPRLGALTMGGSSGSEPSSPVSERRRPRNRRSYERRRPSSSMQSPQSPLSPSSGTYSSDFPPSVPDVPDSQTSSSGTQSTLDTAADHWAKEVFLDQHTTTPLPNVGETSKCLGDPNPGLKRWLRDEGYEELFQLAFTGDSDLRVYMFFREDDHRARIMCKGPRSSRPSPYFCMPLNLLEAYRNGSCLELRRRRRGVAGEVWANLKFSTIERMVLFFCTFLAMRSQDCGRPVARIRDYELDDEVELYGGQIIDDNYLHALRIYQDTITGAVRLQASVHKGEMDRSPVWTAFITDHIKEHIMTRAWIRRSQTDPKAVFLRELHPSVFAFMDYNPQVTARGEHILRFLTRADADAFLRNISELIAELV
ncbi:uncharacterized protein ASPGLDRAFT_65522 [Aspergillus glaucus CBS 516.65]|uniref:Uncharacterized protein n=1 Tax=Aspergillus glaucus CBS 516.65 TaxID=1160497 RepID=A0A1L9VNR1_ASPGL|nr:hypothetical protein ASPGLDRAFT_65522 [Aspergillus glaucus CBS 516.65]OJJ85534.1 hypothetical protein ASPGLDRAFT_65522 [Aspergillus glaucus CBS 516.65]